MRDLVRVGVRVRVRVRVRCRGVVPAAGRDATTVRRGDVVAG